MDADKPPSSNGTVKPGLWRRLSQAFRSQPPSRDELLNQIREAKEDPTFDREEQAMLEGVMDVSETQVREVMVPRSQMVVLEHDQSFEDMLETIIESGHSRFPVLGADRDEVLGVLLAKDLLRYVGAGDDVDRDVTRFLRPVALIPESKRLNALLKDFRASRSHMAVVVDEYGGISGLATIEDVLEEIVGEIDDEHDIEEDAFIREDDALADGTTQHTVRAITRIDEFNEYFRTEFDDEDYDTVGGLVIHELGHVPRRGESIEFGGFMFTVARADRRRVDMLKVRRLDDSRAA
ncbi:MAG: transporter associated domain-containing protein [Pseudomonadota bacterium]